MATDRRAEHEAFIAGHEGCGVWELMLHLALPCLIVCLTDQLRCCACFHGNGGRRLLVALEILLLCGSAVMQLTLLADHVLASVCAATAALLLLMPAVQRDNDQFVASLPEPRRLFKDFQAVLLLQTAVAILAVDFPAMPRRLAKTEAAGLSPMDVGAPAFAFASGLFAAAPSAAHWRRALTSAAPLAALGLARTLAVKAASYQEHVTEYGVHWNFFLTLACLRAAWPALSGRPVTWALALALCHTCLVLPRGGSDFLASPDRQSLWPLAANKEGLLSLIPYMALYCAGAGLARMATGPATAAWPLLLAAGAGLPPLLLGGLPGPGWLPPLEPASRRLFNLAFLLACLGSCCLVLLLLLAGRLLCLGGHAPSAFLGAVGAAALPFFLLSNLLTGAVNLACDTVRLDSAWQTVAILAAYLACLVAALPALAAVATRLPWGSARRRGKTD